MSTIHNPLLPGFNPDPSIIEANGAFYIATSTFQWFPGICIYKSFDLKNWKLISCPLNRLSQLDMKGNPDSGGI
ncbi:TPA: family 43 glycosylhydrolase, partial [Enterobacter ludwigii]|nr:family 43 glycosylhydrolase [Enterobacter ludwigii]